MSGPVRFVAVLIAAVALAVIGVYLGAWWAPFPIGIVAGVLLPRTWPALVAGAVAGLAAFSVPLIAEQLQFGLKETSLSLAAIMGFNGAAVVPFAFTLLVGPLLGLSGAWLATAVRGLLPAGMQPVGGRPARPAEAKDAVLAER